MNLIKDVQKNYIMLLKQIREKNLNTWRETLCSESRTHGDAQRIPGSGDIVSLRRRLLDVWAIWP